MITPISASGLEALVGENGCERRAYNTYVGGVREDAGQGAQAGTLIHGVLDPYLRKGTPIDPDYVWGEYRIGDTAIAMSKLLPFTPEKATVRVEEKFGYEDAPWAVDGIHFRGGIDWISLPHWGDWKSTSSRRYAKTKKTLPKNIQFSLYSRFIDEDSTASWIYGLPRCGPDESRAWAVSVKVEKQKIRDNFGEIVLKPAHRFLKMLEAKDMNSLDGNFNSCHAYNNICPLHPSVGGPCHHPSTKEKFMSLLKNKKPLFEKLREEQTIEKPVPIETLEQEGDGINSPPMPTSIWESNVSNSSPKTTLLDKILIQELADLTTENDTGTTEGKKKRGRPRKDVQVAVTPEVIDVQVAVTTIGEIDDHTNKSKPIYNLYISCLPLGNHDVTYAHELIAKASEAVCADMQLLHVKLAEFGKGGPMLAAQLKADLIEHPVHSLYLDGRSTESYDVRQILMSLAQNIIVGGV